MRRAAVVQILACMTHAQPVKSRRGGGGEGASLSPRPDSTRLGEAASNVATYPPNEHRGENVRTCLSCLATHADSATVRPCRGQRARTGVARVLIAALLAGAAVLASAPSAALATGKRTWYVSAAASSNPACSAASRTVPFATIAAALA